MAGRTYIENCLKKGPSRKVQNHRGNSLVRFTSNKLGTQIMLESRHGELPLAVLTDADSNTVCFFAQPPELSIDIKDETGRIKTSTTYTPDLLVIRSNEIVALESRDLTTLCKATVKNSYQFYKDEVGRWHYRGAEEALSQLGIKLEVFDNSRIPAVLVRNLRFLEDYTSHGCQPIDPNICDQLVAYIQDRKFVPFHYLIHEASFAADDIFKAVATRAVYVDLTTDLLDSTSDLIIFSNETLHTIHRKIEVAALPPPLPVPGTMVLRTGSKIVFDKKQYAVVLVGERDVLVRDEDAVTSTLPLDAIRHLHESGQIEADGLITNADSRTLAQCSPEALQRALKRLEAIDEPEKSIYSTRAINGFRAQVIGGRNRLEALLALTDRQADRGNRYSRISLRNRELGSAAITSNYNTPERGSKKSAYLVYQNLCVDVLEDSGQQIKPVSYQAFCGWCDDQESVKMREGKRANYQASRIVQSLDNAYPVHGTRPHEVCYIDHTVVNLATVSPHGVDLGKPTLTLASDGHTKHPRAMVLTYDPPSNKLVLLALRDYVRRWGRLPRVISVDNGPEFHSKELAFFCKIFEIEIRNRPPGMPRGGGPIERLLGATEEEIFAQQQGNTRQMKDPRLVTKSVNPYNRAIWTLTATYYALEEYAFDIRPNRVHPALGMPPNEFEQLREKETGYREHRLVRFDENLMLMTAPHARRPFHKVDIRRGIWVDNLWYQHPALRTIKKNTKVEVRVEPWLHRVVYVLVNGKWVAATAGNSRLIGNRTRREIEVSLREEKRISQISANKATVNSKSSRQLPSLWLPQRFDPRLAEQQKEMIYLYTPLGMTYAMKIEVSPPLPTDIAEEYVLKSNNSCLPLHHDDNARTHLEGGNSKSYSSESVALNIPTISQTGFAENLKNSHSDEIPGYY